METNTSNEDRRHHNLLRRALPGCRLQPAGPSRSRSRSAAPGSCPLFDRLYGENCSGCHGFDGSHGPATDLANPEYQALVDDNTLRTVITNGEKSTLMPGFGAEAGGTLTPQQIEVIIRGMRARWGRPNPFNGATPPPYKATEPGDASKGQAVYSASLRPLPRRRPHSVPARPAPSSKVRSSPSSTRKPSAPPSSPAALTSASPDWRNHIPGRAMTGDEISNVTAWLLAQRPAAPGQPYPNYEPNSHLPREATRSPASPRHETALRTPPWTKNSADQPRSQSRRTRPIRSIGRNNPAARSS